MKVIPLFSNTEWLKGKLTHIEKSRTLFSNGITLHRFLVVIDGKKILVDEEDVEGFCVGEVCILERSKIKKYEN